jgi:phosphinothricin acetyltransferase
MSIRPVSSADFQTIADIYNYYVERTVVSFEEASVSAAEIEQRVEHVRGRGLPWLVAEDRQANLVGYAYAGPWKARSAYRFAVELTVYLDRQYVAQGWGTRLYRAILNALKDTPTKTVVAGITLPNPASVAIHEKFGLKKVAHFKNVGFKFDRWLDVGYWQADIDDVVTQWR